jgi:hypothetical protein
MLFDAITDGDDPFLQKTTVIDRLYAEYLKHKRLIIAFDFDDTLYDFKNQKFGHSFVGKLMRDCKEKNFYVVIFTASDKSRYDFIRTYIKSTFNVDVDSINENPIPLPYGNNGKIYYNLLLDDRAGLWDSTVTLVRLLKKVDDLEKKTANANIIYAPGKYCISSLKVFLAGSIEMGKAIDWQAEVSQALEKYPIQILNPRRHDWDSNWVQEKTNPQFNEQVNWEIDALRDAQIVLFNFVPGTISPISLFELGHMVDYGSKVLVCCPKGFHRKGNVDVVCEKYSVPVYESLDQLIIAAKEVLTFELNR